MSEVVVIVKLEVPRCSLTHGTAPCTATQTGNAICHNTFFTCNDENNYTPTTQDLYFTRGYIAEDNVVDNALPFIESLSTTPGTLNPAGLLSTEKGIGFNTTLSLTMINVPNSQFLVDPYRAQRSYDMRNAAFWTLWLERNPYHVGLKLTLYEGFLGQTLGEMQSRIFYTTKITANRESAYIEAEDPTRQLIDSAKKVPEKSPGVLLEDILEDQLTIPLKRANVADYPSSGFLRINDELIAYNNIIENPRGPYVIATARGAEDTEASTHLEDDAVQAVFEIKDANIDEAIGYIIDNSDASIEIYDQVQAAAEIEEWRYLWRGKINRLISEPTPVVDLLSELCRQTLVAIDYDEYAGKYKLIAIHGVGSSTPVLTDHSDIVADSFSKDALPEKRASNVVMRYMLRSATSDPEDVKSYRSNYLVNGPGEGEYEHKVSGVKEVFIKWYTHEVLIMATGLRLSVFLQDVIRTCSFSLTAKNRGIRRGDLVILDTQDDLDTIGNRKKAAWLLTKVYESEPGEIIDCEAVDVSNLGRVGRILPNGSAAYQGDGSDNPDGAYILNADGTLPDGKKGWTPQ